MRVVQWVIRSRVAASRCWVPAYRFAGSGNGSRARSSAALLLVAVLTTAACGPDAAGAEDGTTVPASATPAIRIPAEDRALWANVQGGRFTALSLAEAALLASGVTDPGRRAPYLGRLDALEQQARGALAGAQTPFERGEKLLVWLHGPSRPLQKYVETQTDLSVLLDTGTFNCVSSAVLYNVLGRRVGLDVRAVEVSDHAFSIVYDGDKSADVETTTPHGFNPLRDRKAAAALRDQTGYAYIPERHKHQRREIDEAGLVAAIYFNHGVMASREKRFGDALVASINALNLDPDAFAAKAAHAALARWTADLARQGRLEEAVGVLDEARGMINNPLAMKKVTWAVYDIAAHDLITRRDWQGAVALYVKALQRLPGDSHLARNERAAWDGWARECFEAGKWAEAIGVYSKALERYPRDRTLLNNKRYCEQQSLRPPAAGDAAAAP